ncbi:MAG: PEP-CTERM sorting domain-containing protein [Pseudomonadota bacterium]
MKISLANPVPEPETYALMLAGLGLIGLAAKRRR